MKNAPQMIKWHHSIIARAIDKRLFLNYINNWYKHLFQLWSKIEKPAKGRAFRVGECRKSEGQDTGVLQHRPESTLSKLIFWKPGRVLCYLSENLCWYTGEPTAAALLVFYREARYKIGVALHVNPAHVPRNQGPQLVDIFALLRRDEDNRVVELGHVGGL